MGRRTYMEEFGNFCSNRDSIPRPSTQQRIAIPTTSSRFTHLQGKYFYFSTLTMDAVASAEAYEITFAFNSVTFFDRDSCKPERLILNHYLQKHKLVTVNILQRQIGGTN
jgi:hypothetical protein